MRTVVSVAGMVASAAGMVGAVESIGVLLDVGAAVCAVGKVGVVDVD